MEVAVRIGGMANTTVVHKPGKHPRLGTPMLNVLRLALALLFLGAAFVLLRQGASRSTWLALSIYLFLFVATDRIAFAVRLRILNRESGAGKDTKRTESE
jgi:hypothetical protein